MSIGQVLDIQGLFCFEERVGARQEKVSFGTRTLKIQSLV